MWSWWSFWKMILPRREKGMMMMMMIRAVRRRKKGRMIVERVWK